MNRSPPGKLVRGDRNAHVVLTYCARHCLALQARAQALLQFHPRQLGVLATLSFIAMI
jgi:hypothetical protein